MIDCQLDNYHRDQNQYFDKLWFDRFIYLYRFNIVLI